MQPIIIIVVFALLIPILSGCKKTVTPDRPDERSAGNQCLSDGMSDNLADSMYRAAQCQFKCLSPDVCDQEMGWRAMVVCAKTGDAACRKEVADHYGLKLHELKQEPDPEVLAIAARWKREWDRRVADRDQKLKEFLVRHELNKSDSYQCRYHREGNEIVSNCSR